MTTVENDVWRPRWASWAGIAVTLTVLVALQSYISTFGSWAALGWIVWGPVWTATGIGAILLAVFLARGGKGKFVAGWTLIAFGLLMGLLYRLV